MAERLDARQALEFVRQHGIVLASAKGHVPRLIEAILGVPISGNWWTHPDGSFIYNVLAEVSDSDEILLCRLVDGKRTLVHRRLWPALVRVAHRFDPAQLAKVCEEHTPSGRHVKTEVAFPHWVPPEVDDEARLLSAQDALLALGGVIGAQKKSDR